MGKREKVRIVQSDLQEHPAFLAWRELQRGSAKPERIEILKGKVRRHNSEIKRLVCKLVGVGTDGASVIGKRCIHNHAVIENAVYEEILPYLPIPSLKYYGMVEEANGVHCWLFLDYVGEREYSAHIEKHRLLRAQWLAIMHTSATHLEAPANFPDKGSKHYLECLQSVRDTIEHHLGTLALQANDIASLKTIVSQCELLETHWRQVEAICEELPETLVHGDFVKRNLRIRNSQFGITLFPFDWGEAGWGAPAIDIMHVDLGAYRSIVRDNWPWLNSKEIQRSAKIGKIFRCLDAISWDLPDFNYQWLTKPLGNMRIYESWLDDAITAAGLVD